LENTTKMTLQQADFVDAQTKFRTKNNLPNGSPFGRLPASPARFNVMVDG
jgi:hypothetical protein